MYFLDEKGSFLKYVPKKFITENYCLQASKNFNTGNIIKSIPENMLSYQMCVNIVKNHGSYIRFVPKKFRDDNLIRYAVLENPSSIKYISRKKQNEEFAKLAVSISGYSLKYVFDKTYDICKTAVLSNGEALEFVPGIYKDLDLCLSSFINSRDWRELIQFIPRSKRYELLLSGYDCTSAPSGYTTNRLMMDYFFEDIIENKEFTYSRCLSMVKENYNYIQDIPSKYINKEIVLAAIGSLSCLSNVCRGDIPTEFLTYGICLEACHACGCFIVTVPKKFISKEICLAAVRADPESLKYIPKTMKDYELCYEAAKSCCYALRYIPDRLKDYELCWAAANCTGGTKIHSRQ
ncbi:MAG: DUF4116 domain-containing protein [Desulfovibrio sp.]|nr:DUF4116 domain-containing protein [Desulfovibrio sp.]